MDRRHGNRVAKGSYWHQRPSLRRRQDCRLCNHHRQREGVWVFVCRLPCPHLRQILGVRLGRRPGLRHCHRGSHHLRQNTHPQSPGYLVRNSRLILPIRRNIELGIASFPGLSSTAGTHVASLQNPTKRQAFRPCGRLFHCALKTRRVIFSTLWTVRFHPRLYLSLVGSPLIP